MSDHTTTPTDPDPGRRASARRQQLGAIAVGALVTIAVLVFASSRGSNEGTEGTVRPRPTSTTVAFDVRSLIGMTETDATAEAERNGWTVRVVARDGEEYMVTMDYVDTRANLSIEADIVVDATAG